MAGSACIDPNGHGIPALLYDPCCMKAQTKNGVSKDDVWKLWICGLCGDGNSGEGKCDDGACKAESAKALGSASAFREKIPVVIRHSR